MLKICFVTKAQEYTHSTPVLNDLFHELGHRGLGVNRISPEEDVVEVDRIEPSADLYVLKPGVELGLSLAGVLHDKGARILNSFPACSLIQDKVRVAALLRRAGIAAPRSFVSGSLSAVQARLGWGAVVSKPHRGSYGEGIEIVPAREATDAPRRGGYFAQEFAPSDGEDLKVYVIGEQVFALKRKFPATTFEEKLGRPVPVSAEVRDIALCCGRLFDLQIYGLDILETESGPLVIDVNYFPGFIGVNNAAGMLAEYIHDYARNGPMAQSAVTPRRAPVAASATGSARANLQSSAWDPVSVPIHT